MKLQNETQYREYLSRINLIMKKGETKVSEKELHELKTLTDAVQEYEKRKHNFPKH